MSTFREGDEQYDVRLRLLQDFRNSPRVISQVMVPAASGRLVRLNNVTEFSAGKAPGQIDRFNGEAARNFLLALILSLAFIYMVLASQFESFVHPVTIMLSLPLCLPFGLLTLAVTGQSLNVNSILGVFLLMGVVNWWPFPSFTCSSTTWGCRAGRGRWRACRPPCGTALPGAGPARSIPGGPDRQKAEGGGRGLHGCGGEGTRREKPMPTVTVEGPRLPLSRKRRLVEVISRQVAAICRWPVERVAVIIHENPDANVARGGVLLADWKPSRRRRAGQVRKFAAWEVDRLLHTAQEFGQLMDLIRPRGIPAAGGRNVLRFEPYGVVGVVTASDVPLLVPFYTLASSLGGGNAAVLKPSGAAPLTARKLFDLLAPEWPEGAVQFSTCSGEAAAQEFMENPEVDVFLTYAGSAVGKHNLIKLGRYLEGTKRQVGGCMLHVGGRMKKYIPELAGNDPFLVLPGAENPLGDYRASLQRVAIALHRGRDGRSEHGQRGSRLCPGSAEPRRAFGYPALTRPAEATEEEVRADLQAWVAAFGAPGVSVEAVVAAGPADRVILKAIEVVQPHLVVMGTHGRSGYRRWVMGSTTESVLREIRVPVLTVREGCRRLGTGDKEPMRLAIRRILWATDDPGPPQLHLQVVMELARAVGSTITLLHCLEAREKLAEDGALCAEFTA
ncbi:MAG: aldehyde dehydrogenase family protein [candidate division NC10 bacterium]|nr:aldehyde dehydrogenase family protein [candidate division NC10 bacterium]